MNAAPLRRSAVATIAACLLLAALTVGSPGRAQEPVPAVRLHVTQIDAMAGPEVLAAADGALSLRALIENEGDDGVSDLRLHVEVFEPVATRSALHLAVDENRPQGRLLADAFVEIAGDGELPAGEIATSTVEVPHAAFGGDGGIHPVRISLTYGREVVDETTTATVHRSEEPARALPTLLAWPLWAAPAPPQGLDGLGREVAPGGRLERLVWALEQHPTAPVQAVVAPHLLEDLALHAADEPEGLALLERIESTLGARPAPVVSPYADADLAGLAATGQTVEALQHLLEARRLTEELLGRPPADALWETGTVSSLALRSVVAPARIRDLLVPWDRLEESGEPTETPASVRAFTPGGAGTTALVSDPWLERRLADLGRGPDPVAIQTILAESALIHRERPFATDRALLLLPPPDWAPSPEAAEGLLAALRGAPWLELEGVDGLAARGLRTDGTARLSPPEGSSADAPVWPALASAREQLGTVRDAIAEPVDGLGGLSWSELDRRILRAASASAGPQASRARLDEVSAALAEGIGDLQLPEEAQITLTDVEGTVPITIARTDGPPVHVTVTLEAPPRLRFPEGASRSLVIGPGDRRTLTFDAAAHAVGRVPVTINATLGPAGSPVGYTAGTVVVRSTAVSGFALGALGVVLAIVGIWWAVRWRRSPPPPELRLVEREAA